MGRIKASCRRTAASIAARSRSQRCVEPSISVKAKVIVPLGVGDAAASGDKTPISSAFFSDASVSVAET
jgi:hypothetical protein